MLLPLSSLIERLRSSLWVLPAIFALGSVALSEVALEMDAWFSGNGADYWYLYPGGIDGSRSVLAALAGSMVSLTTISFSVMMVVLTLASNQFGPRVLRNFISDRFNQVALGIFVSTFLYCLLVLGRVPDAGEEGLGVPRLAVTLALVLTTISLGTLIAFIHHVARSIQASQVVLRAHLEEVRAIDSLYPEDLGDGVDRPEALVLPPGFDEQAEDVDARRSGHVQAIKGDDIVEFAREHDALVHLHVRPGGFVTCGDRLAKIWYYGAPPNPRPDHAALVHDWIILGSERTGEQDAQYGLRQLTEIAVRALSSGINDPVTAVSCINYVGDNLARLGRRDIPSPQRRDAEGVLRAVLPRDGFDAIATAAFESLRRYARGHPEVMERLVGILVMLSSRLRRSSDRAWARDALAAMAEEANYLEARRDRMRFRDVCRRAREALRAPRAGTDGNGRAPGQPETPPRVATPPDA